MDSILHGIRVFPLLIWKEFKVYRRRPVASALEFIIPCLAVWILIWARSKTTDFVFTRCQRPLEEDQKSCEWDPFYPSSYPDSMKHCKEDGWVVAYAPQSVSTFVENALYNLGGGSANGFDEEKQVLYSLKYKDASQGCRVGIIFNNMDTSSDVSYKIRMEATPGGYSTDSKNDQPPTGWASFLPTWTWMTDISFPFLEFQGPRSDIELFAPSHANVYGNAPNYYKAGFLAWQNAINHEILANTGADTTEYDNVQLNRMPYPEYKMDYFLFALQFGYPLLLMLAFLFSALSITREIALEKERGMRVVLQMMGTTPLTQMGATFAKNFICLFLPIAVVTMETIFGKVLEYTDGGVLLVFLLLFAASSIAFCFLVSSLFHTASGAAAGAGIFWFLSYLPFFLVFNQYAESSGGKKTGLCVFSNTALALGAKIISIREGTGEGVNWGNVDTRLADDDSFTFATVLWMLVVDTLLYMTLAWYIENINPGQFGIPRSVTFPVDWFLTPLMDYIVPSRKNNKSNSEQIPLLSQGNSAKSVEGVQESAVLSVHEECPRGHRVGVALKGLTKTFDEKMVVGQTNFNFLEDQITVLLGHNGAGKTTILRMLTGMIPPTAGTASILGFDIRSETTQAQTSLGVCPQHDILFDSLTVYEHLQFFCHLKGVPRESVNNHVESMLESLELTDKAKCLAKTLSGGQMRKLSCGIALVGGSRVVVLDEPTSGMDPAARRATWKLLLDNKEDRTILLTTHFMEEADILGDRVSIVVSGHMECSGTSFFLKSKFGNGYKLTLVQNPDCQKAKVARFVKSLLPNAKFQSIFGSEILYNIPNAEGLGSFFKNLEQDKALLGVQSYGIAIESLEDVFVHVGERVALAHDGYSVEETMLEEPESGVNKIQRKLPPLPPSGEHPPSPEKRLYGTRCKDDSHLVLDDVQHSPPQKEHQPATGWPLRKVQLQSLIHKRWISMKRNRYHIGILLVPPFLFTLLALIIVKASYSDKDLPSRDAASLVTNYGDNNILMLDGDNQGEEFFSALQTQYSNYKQNFKWVPNVTASGSPTNASAYLLNQSSGNAHHTSVFNRRTLFCMEMSEETGGLVAWFNGQGYHTVSEALNLAASGMLGMYSGGSVSVENHPLPRTADEWTKANKLDETGFTISFAVMFGVAPLASSVVLFVVKESASKAKHVQYIAGINPFIYWTANFLIDFGTFMSSCFITFLLFPMFHVEEFMEEQWFALLLLGIAYGASVLPLMYMLSFLFKDSTTAFIRLTLLNVISGLGAQTAIYVMDVSDPDSAQKWRSIFMMLPNFNFAQGINDLYSNHQTRSIVAEPCKLLSIPHDKCCAELSSSISEFDLDYDIKCTDNIFQWAPPGVGKYFTVMLLEALVFFTALIFIEFALERKNLVLNWFKFYYKRIMKEIYKEKYVEEKFDYDVLDEDVRNEYKRVQEILADAKSNVLARRSTYQSILASDQLNLGKQQLVMDKIMKTYATGFLGLGQEKKAVRGLTLAVAEGECFGLLGTNGAGKTSTFRMLTGDLTVTKGDAYISGQSIMISMNSLRRNYGYCPQFDAVFDYLTGRETLHLYARLRGLSESEIYVTVNDILDSLSLTPHADKLARTYSGGNKRKLCNGVALVGNPVVLFLDEPTTGMDPVARRHVARVLTQARRKGQSVILTSHSMDECQALCQRLGVIVDGQLQCVGTPTHLRTRFGKSYFVTVRASNNLEQDNNITVEKMILGAFPAATTREQHVGVSHFAIPSDAVSLGDIFQQLEQFKAQGVLSEYTVAQTGLEQIFLDIAETSQRQTMQIP
eukprot:m.87594 g.87594  ORF g.87594 m.87594 type:complete len:1794 (+) comp13118_c0_seq1:164-5545(+)